MDNISSFINGLKAKFSDAELLVDPSILTEKSFEVQAAVDSIKTSFDSIEELIAKTSSYWKGTGGDYYRDKYKKNKEEINEILLRLNEHPAELRIMANNYQQVENKATEQNTRLRSDYV